MAPKLRMLCVLYEILYLFFKQLQFLVPFWLNTFFMKYFNKTRTIEDKVNNRDLLRILQEQNQLLKQILACLEGNHKAE